MRHRTGIYRHRHHKQEPPILLIFVGLLVIAMAFVSCRMLQDVKGYEKYEKNTDWGR